MTAFIGLGSTVPVGQKPFISNSVVSPCRQHRQHTHHTHHRPVSRRPARFVRSPPPATSSRRRYYHYTCSSEAPQASSADESASSSTITASSSTDDPASSVGGGGGEASPADSSSASASASVDTSPAPTKVPADQISEAEAKAFRAKYEPLRGADVETVSSAMQRFTGSFRRPIPIVYRSVVNETISTTHLARVCPMWRYDALFALGYDAVFSTFLKFYPDASERDALFNAVATSLKFNPDDLRADADAAAAAIDGMSEKELFAALDGTSSAESAANGVLEAMAYVRDAGYGDWYYSRLFGIGLITVMDSTGTTLDAATAEKWATKIGVEFSKFGAEMGAYLSGLERLKQAEQIFAEATAREAKKTAERLSAKAKKAADEAAKLEGSATTADDDTPSESSPESSESAESPKA